MGCPWYMLLAHASSLAIQIPVVIRLNFPLNWSLVIIQYLISNTVIFKPPLMLLTHQYLWKLYNKLTRVCAGHRQLVHCIPGSPLGDFVPPLPPISCHYVCQCFKGSQISQFLKSLWMWKLWPQAWNVTCSLWSPGEVLKIRLLVYHNCFEVKLICSFWTSITRTSLGDQHWCEIYKWI